MHKKGKLYNVLINPYTLAFYTTIILSILLPNIDRYKISLDKYFLNDKENGQSIYADLDGDSISELITSFNNNSGSHAIKILNSEEQVIDQWNFSGSHPRKEQRFLAGDYNNNGFKEVYLFSEIGDSILLSLFEPLNSDGGIYKTNIFIDSISTNRYAKRDYRLYIYPLKDMDKDGCKDLVFSILAGFSLQPRKIYIYNVKQDTLFETAPSGSIPTALEFADIDSDGFDEITGSCYSIGNMKVEDPYPYPDSSAWFMVYEHDLSFKFDPYEFPGFKTAIKPLVFEQNDSYYFLIFKIDSFSENNSLMLFNSRGELLKQKDIHKHEHFYFPLGASFFNNHYPDKLVFFDKSGNILRTDTSLRIIKMRNPGLNNHCLLAYDDLNGNGSKELIFYENSKGTLKVVNSNLRNVTTAKTELSRSFDFTIFSIKLNGEHPPQFYIQLDSHCYLFSYRFNSAYIFNFIRPVGIYFLILLFIFLIRRLYAIQIKQKREMEYRLLELQLKTVKNQINPHFLFNSLNAVSHSVYKENRKEAHQKIAKISNLLRQAISDSDKIDHSLGEEFDFIKKYLDLEKDRFRNKLHYQIDVKPSLQEHIFIPKMLLQTFVENSVRHGIAPKGYGIIEISLKQRNNSCSIFIKDDGIGRHEAKRSKTKGTGSGLKIVNKIIEIYEKVKKVKIEYFIVDLYDKENKPDGTMIEVRINC